MATNISKYAQLNDFLLLEYEFNRDGTTVDFVGEGITPMEAIRAYTIDEAYSAWEENIKGSIKTGKLADLVVVDDFTGEPYEKLVNARETSLTLVVIKINPDR